MFILNIGKFHLLVEYENEIKKRKGGFKTSMLSGKYFIFFTSVLTKMNISESQGCQWSSFLSGKVHNSLF